MSGVMNMNKYIVSAALGMIVGIYIGYHEEDELEEICHKSKKAKRKMMKKLHHAGDMICDCLD